NSTSGTRRKIIALENAFHGRTMGALALTWKPQYREPFAPLPGGVTFVPAGDFAALQAELDDTVAAVVIEPVQGEAGVRNFPAGYLAQRSEEHTSELQSRFALVCRLLPDK